MALVAPLPFVTPSARWGGGAGAGARAGAEVAGVLADPDAYYRHHHYHTFGGGSPMNTAAMAYQYPSPDEQEAGQSQHQSQHQHQHQHQHHNHHNHQQQQQSQYHHHHQLHNSLASGGYLAGPAGGIMSLPAPAPARGHELHHQQELPPAQSLSHQPQPQQGRTPGSRRQNSTETGGMMLQSGKRKPTKLGYPRALIACEHCRKRKIRCEMMTRNAAASSGGATQKCVSCTNLRKECVYKPASETARAHHAAAAAAAAAGRPAGYGGKAPSRTSSTASMSSPSTQQQHGGMMSSSIIRPTGPSSPSGSSFSPDAEMDTDPASPARIPYQQYAAHPLTSWDAGSVPGSVPPRPPHSRIKSEDGFGGGTAAWQAYLESPPPVAVAQVPQPAPPPPPAQPWGSDSSSTAAAATSSWYHHSMPRSVPHPGYPADHGGYPPPPPRPLEGKALYGSDAMTMSPGQGYAAVASWPQHIHSQPQHGYSSSRPGTGEGATWPCSGSSGGGGQAGASVPPPEACVTPTAQGHPSDPVATSGMYFAAR